MSETKVDAVEAEAKARAKAEYEAKKKSLPPAALRALEEAEARRKTAEAASPLPPEKGGRKGPEPTRYGDWEKKGILSDF